MPKQNRIQFTLSNDSTHDAGLWRHLSQYQSGAGKSERACEIKRLLRVALVIENGRQVQLDISTFEVARNVNVQSTPQQVQISPPPIEKNIVRPASMTDKAPAPADDPNRISSESIRKSLNYLAGSEEYSKPDKASGSTPELPP